MVLVATQPNRLAQQLEDGVVIPAGPTSFYFHLDLFVA